MPGMGLIPSVYMRARTSPAKSIQGWNERLQKQSLPAPYLLKAKVLMHHCEPTTFVHKVASQCSTRLRREACVKRLRFLFGYGIPLKNCRSANVDDAATVFSSRISPNDKWQSLYYDQFTPCFLHFWCTWRYAKALLIWEHSSVDSFYDSFTRDGFVVWIHESVCRRKGCSYNEVFSAHRAEWTCLVHRFQRLNSCQSALIYLYPFQPQRSQTLGAILGVDCFIGTFWCIRKNTFVYNKNNKTK